MIDLKELERRLDEALAKETSESLTSWLSDQRRDNLANFLGDGCIEQFKQSPYTFNQHKPKSTQFKVSDVNNPDDNLATAA